MNGLKYIRTRCNLSLNDLADIIGVTRQALSSWENERKEIPPRRKKELSDFFGVDKEFFGEISEAEKNALLEKALFRYDENGKETYRYKPNETSDFLQVCFFPDNEESFDEQYVQAQNERKKLLSKISDIVNWTDTAGSIQSQIACIQRGCTVYGITTQLMEKMKGQATFLKMPFFYELLSVWEAMLLAHDLLDESDVTYLDRTQEYYCATDGEWTIKLAAEMREHWKQEYDFHNKHYEELRSKIRSEQNKAPKEKTKLDDTIREIEERNRCSTSEKLENGEILGVTSVVKKDEIL